MSLSEDGGGRVISCVSFKRTPRFDERRLMIVSDCNYDFEEAVWVSFSSAMVWAKSILNAMNSPISDAQIIERLKGLNLLCTFAPTGLTKHSWSGKRWVIALLL